MRSDARGWKLPSRQLKFGEDPRDAARQIGHEMLGLKGLTYSEPRVEVDFWKLGKDASGPRARRKLRHFDVWFFVEARLPGGREVELPPWLAQLSWRDPARLKPREWSRYHNDVVARWKVARPRK